MNTAILGFAAILGLMGWIVHLLFIIQSLRSKKRWTLYIDYNTMHEGVLEILLILGLIIFYIFVLVELL